MVKSKEKVGESLMKRVERSRDMSRGKKKKTNIFEMFDAYLDRCGWKLI